MRGQWIGKYTGNVHGDITINIDETENGFVGIAYLKPNDKSLPPSAAHFTTDTKVNIQEVVALVNPVDPRNGFQCKWPDIKHLYGESIVHADRANVTIKMADDALQIQAFTNNNAKIYTRLEQPRETDESLIPGKRMTWSEFKSHITQRSRTKFMFRGQRQPWRLRTSFHRHGRYLMSRFTEQDVRQLHRRLSAITTHYFNLAVPEQNGAFFNLMQHHGYPTPLLDWSHSPYVAAFFALRDWPIQHCGDGVARIYIFNEQAWREDFPQIQNLDPAFLHLSVMEFIAIDNPRLVPQQSVTTVTNIDDIEAYMLARENDMGKKYIEAIDIQASDREEAMRDLRFMGITPGSIFPSIDGVCEELRECNFDR